LDDEGREVTLVTGEKDPEELRSLERLLERRLGIGDVPVDGEATPRSRVA